MTEPDPTITINDIRLAGHCPAGARKWFADHALDFRQFVRPIEQGGGLPASMLLALPDNALAVQVIERKMVRENG